MNFQPFDQNISLWKIGTNDLTMCETIQPDRLTLDLGFMLFRKLNSDTNENGDFNTPAQRQHKK